MSDDLDDRIDALGRDIERTIHRNRHYLDEAGEFDDRTDTAIRLRRVMP